MTNPIPGELPSLNDAVLYNQFIAGIIVRSLCRNCMMYNIETPIPVQLQSNYQTMEMQCGDGMIDSVNKNIHSSTETSFPS